LGAFQKLRNRFLGSSCLFVRPSVRPSVRSYGTPQFPLDGFSSNLVCEYFSRNVGSNLYCLESDNNIRYITWLPVHICDGSLLSSSWSDKCFRQMMVKKKAN
jgi:hypothetical protein